MLALPIATPKSIPCHQTTCYHVFAFIHQRFPFPIKFTKINSHTHYSNHRDDFEKKNFLEAFFSSSYASDEKKKNRSHVQRRSTIFADVSWMRSVQSCMYIVNHYVRARLVYMRVHSSAIGRCYFCSLLNERNAERHTRVARRPDERAAAARGASRVLSVHLLMNLRAIVNKG